jgi:dihydropteroate synthase
MIELGRAQLPIQAPLVCGNKVLDFSTPKVMGVLNITPDSAVDGGHYLNLTAALERALAMVEEGAAIIDIGGEATNPQLNPFTPVDEELARVIPVIKALRRESDILISVDTSKSEVMRQAIDAGADIINDVRALREPGAMDVVAAAQVPVCLMHMQYPHGKSNSLDAIPPDVDIVSMVKEFLIQRIAACMKAGIPLKNIVVDPGIGHGNFGKNLQQNLLLLKHLETFHDLGVPLLVGTSRKTFIGELLNVPINERMIGSIASAVIAVTKGASIIRAHDVIATTQALQMVSAILGA